MGAGIMGAGMMRAAALVLALVLLVLAPAVQAKIYTEAELANFHIADVKLDMAADDAFKKLTARKFIQDTSDPNPTTATWKGPNEAIVTLQLSSARKVVAIGLFQPLPGSITMEQITTNVVPSLVDRFGEPTKTEPAGQMVVMTYVTAAAAAGQVAMTIRISRAGIDGRLGR
jgi:hypothetical protein